MTLTRVLQPLMQLAFSALLSATTLVFGAMPLLWLRRSTHGFVFVTWCTVVTLLGTQVLGFNLWIPFLLNSVLVFFYVLYESLWDDLLTAAGLSTLTTGALTFFGFTLWLEYRGLTISGVFREKAQEFVAQMQLLRPTVKIDVDSLLPQIPSVFMILLALCLWIALLSESPWATESKPEESKKLTRLQGFRIPDVFIWIVLASVFFAFADVNLPTLQKVAINLVYMSVILYLFQGLAVVGTFFTWQRWGHMWQILAYVILITQLFLAVSFLGIVDFWLDFRERMVKKSAHRTGEVEQ